MERILVFGAHTHLGREMVTTLSQQNQQVLAIREADPGFTHSKIDDVLLDFENEADNARIALRIEDEPIKLLYCLDPGRDALRILKKSVQALKISGAELKGAYFIEGASALRKNQDQYDIPSTAERAWPHSWRAMRTGQAGKTFESLFPEGTILRRPPLWDHPEEGLKTRLSKLSSDINGDIVGDTITTKELVKGVAQILGDTAPKQRTLHICQPQSHKMIDLAKQAIEETKEENWGFLPDPDAALISRWSQTLKPDMIVK